MSNLSTKVNIIFSHLPKKKEEKERERKRERRREGRKEGTDYMETI